LLYIHISGLILGAQVPGLSKLVGKLHLLELTYKKCNIVHHMNLSILNGPQLLCTLLSLQYH